MNKVDVLVVLILVSVAFSAPALVSGYVEGDGYYEGDGGDEYPCYEGDGYGESDEYYEGDVYDEYPGYEDDEYYEGDVYDEGDKNGEGGGIPPTKTGDKDKKFPKSAAAVVITTIAVAAGGAVVIKNREKIKDKWFSTSPETKSIGEPVAEALPAPPPDTTPEIVQHPPEPPVSPYEQYRRARSRTAQIMAANLEYSRACRTSSDRSDVAALSFALITVVAGVSSAPVLTVFAGGVTAYFYFYGSITGKIATEVQNSANKKKQKLKVLDENMRKELKKKQQEK